MNPLVRDASQRLMFTARKVAVLRSDADEILIEQLRERAREVIECENDAGASPSGDLQVLVSAALAVHRNQHMPCAFDLLDAAHRLCAEALPAQAAAATPGAPEAEPSFWWQREGLGG